MESLQAQLVAVEGGTQERKELKMLQKVIRNLEVEYTFHSPYSFICTLHVFIVRCVGRSKAPPVLHSSYRTDFERDCAV